jgi:hypothetical protein
MSANILTINELYVPGRGDDVSEGDILGVYDLQIGAVAFGQLYVTEDDYTIAWPGNFDEFRYRNDNASHFITKQLDSDRGKLGLRTTGYEAKVTLVVERELRQFRFDSFEKPADYKELSEVGGDVTFARYDFDCRFEGGDVSGAKYAFSTENPAAKSKDNGEMALLLSRTQPLALGLLRDWIADKHIHSRELKRALRDVNVHKNVYHNLMGIARVKTDL